MASITLIARNGGWTGVFTLRPDGHRSGGHSSGPTVHHEDAALSPAQVAAVFELAQLPADVPAGGRPGADGAVTLTIQRDGARRRQFVWPFGARPGDARLLRLLEAVEALKIGGW